MHQIKPFTFLWVLISAMVLAPLASRADDPSNRLAELDAEAVKAYRAKDYARFLALEKQSLALAPSNARVLYNVACGEGLQGNAPEAVRLLDQLLTRKLDLGAETDEDFSSIRKSPSGPHSYRDWRCCASLSPAARWPSGYSTLHWSQLA
jgi:hypothetical protein